MTQFYWQNLAYKKCPRCHSRFIEKESGYECPDHKNGCDFYISRKTIVDYLTDPTHPAVRYLDETGRKELNVTLVKMGIIDLHSGPSIW